MTTIKGTIALLGTPFAADGKIDPEAYRKEAEWCLENGADGLMTAPSVGEFTLLSCDERLLLFQIGLEVARSHGPGTLALAMIAAPSTEETVFYGKQAAAMGYPAVIMVAPWYWHCTDDEVHRHFATAVDRVGLPLCVYNNPPLTGFSMTPGFIHRLLQTPGIEAIKETVVDLTHLHHLFKLLGPEPPVLHIHRAYLYSLVFGCIGSFMAPFSLRAAVACREAFLKGDLHRASEIQTAMASLLPPMGEGGAGLVGMWKAASSAATGIDLGQPRRPHAHPDEKTLQVISDRVNALHAMTERR